LIILLYFDWMGTTRELKSWEGKIKASCQKTDVDYKGLYGSFNEKWNFVCIFKAETFENFLEMGKHVVRHPQMPHHITEILMPQNFEEGTPTSFKQW
jgi:hypothetical protein